MHQDVYITHITVNCETLCTFLKQCLLPHLLPFNGVNPRSVVIVDTLSIHHTDNVVSLIEEVGAMVHYLPPNSPDMHPIEETFSKVKGFLKAYDPFIPVVEEPEILDKILSAFASVTSSDCHGWMKHCGYIQ